MAIKDKGQELQERHKAIQIKLASVVLPNNTGVNVAECVAQKFKITGQTVRNYLSGRIKDGYLAEAIYKEFKRLKMTTK